VALVEMVTVYLRKIQALALQIAVTTVVLVKELCARNTILIIVLRQMSAVGNMFKVIIIILVGWILEIADVFTLEAIAVLLFSPLRIIVFNLDRFVVGISYVAFLVQ
jgi:hypothetical protein